MDVKSEIRELKAEELDKVNGAGLTVVRPQPPTAGLRATVGPFQPTAVGGSDFTTEGDAGGGSKEYDGNPFHTN
jgi:hypothetical protein